jgi:hypothetical protein
VSTNFYLHRDPQNCGECGKPGREAEIHIGKRSVGSVFVWQGFNGDDVPGVPGGLFDAKTWREFLTAEVTYGEGRIESEYGNEYSVEEFFCEVEAQRDQSRPSERYDGFAPVGPDDVSYGDWS